MDKSLRLTKSLGEIVTESGVFELFATANAIYDKQTRAVVVMLNSFLSLRKAKCPHARLFADSVLGRRTVTDQAAVEKYAEVVASIFANWVQSVEQAEPRPFADVGDEMAAVSRAISSVSSLSSNSSNGAGSAGSANRVLAGLARGLS
jgi:hypothetical protein